jgi:cytochrome c biogenesis protein CcmG/thiol:disulfide interchange protein DsbE
MQLKMRPIHWVFILLILSAFVFYQLYTTAEENPLAPEFSLKDIDGNSVSLSQYKGHVILLDFWATWCPPCRVSIPELVGLHKQYESKGLVILGVSVDDPRQVNDKRLRAFIKKYKINYTILRANDEILRDYFPHQQMGFPTMFIINRTGNIVDMHVGFRPGVLEKAIKKVL